MTDPRHPWVMDNNCQKYYPDRTRGLEVMARTQHEDGQKDGQTDRRTDRVIPIYPQTFFVGGGGGIIRDFFLRCMGHYTRVLGIHLHH